MSRYVIGIDLGTTNCALASVDLTPARQAGRPNIETFVVPQLVEVGQFGQQTLLPSYVYLPGLHELPAGSSTLPWDADAKEIVGEAARRQGSRVPGRLVSSAKSWLCHAGVERKAPILPWQADEEVPRLSPVTASMVYLRHLRDAWNWSKGERDKGLGARGKGDERLEEQQIVLTVPASFDAVARELTVEAAKEAGFVNLTLLEEPQAAFYAWLHESTQDSSLVPDSSPATPLPVGTVCVVIDCGGGTTDFSLISVVEREGRGEFERLAVGEHLLLGGDNMDIALARHVEEQISGGRRLDSAQWGNLVAGCRRIKEQMLGPSPPDSQTITVMGRGQKVIGSALRCELHRETVHRMILDGFFPNIGYGEEPLQAGRSGLQEFGLPFVADPAITRHLAAFLHRHSSAIQAASGSFKPNAVLFNGGVFNAEACRRQVLYVMRSWYGSAWEPIVLESDSLDLAVARGAAYFGWAKATGGQRIKSGAARSYYVGIETVRSSEGDHETDQSRSTGQAVLCLAPHGMQEGEQLEIDQVPLELQLGEPVSFPLYTSTVRTSDQAGDVLEVEPGQLAQLPAVTTVLRGGRRAGTKRVPVRLEARLTEFGTLELHCAATDGGNRWKLHFQTRLAPTLLSGEDSSAESENAASGPGLAAGDTWSEEQLEAGRAVLREAFLSIGKGHVERLAQVMKDLEAALGLQRSDWPMSMLRAFWETLHELAPRRRVSVDQEWRWYNLAGFCLRPGWGDPVDAFRVEQWWKVVHPGVVATKSGRAWNEYWVMCRRVAGGLDANRQSELSKRLLPLTGMGGKKSPRRVGGQELAEVWRALASLERLTTSIKAQLGDALIAQMRKPPIPVYLFWSLTRLGARVPLYGPANLVIGKETAEQWLENLLLFDANDSRQQSEQSFAVCQIARCSGDRSLDIDDSLRERVLEWLRDRGVEAHWIRLVAEPTGLDRAEENRLLGDALPPGLKLLAEG